VSGATQDPRLAAEAPFDVERETVTLRFLFSTEDPVSVDALKKARRALIRAVAHRTAGFDAIAMPTVPIIPPKLSEFASRLMRP